MRMSQEAKFELGIMMLFVAVVVAIILAGSGCGGEPNLPPCGPGTYEFRGICLPNDTEPLCGPGTHQLGDICVANKPTTPPPPACRDIEVCNNNKDDDCNGQVDEYPCEQLQEGPDCAAGTSEASDGRCHPNGTACGEGTTFDPQAYKCVPDNESVEVCDGKDNDGDGKADEGCLGTPCKENSECDGGLICSAPTLTTDGKPGGICAIPCKTDADCSAGNVCIETYNNGVSGLMVFSCLPPKQPTTPAATITFTNNKYASDWQVMLGWGSALLAEFEVKGDPNEDVLITELTIADKTQNPLDAGSFKNVKLISVGVVNQIAMVPTFNTKANSAYALAKFTGFKLLVPKGQTLKFNVNADVASYDDGGVLYTEHRFAILEDTELTAGIQPPATAVSAKTGLPVKIIADAEGANHELVKTKPSVAFAADSPSGAVGNAMSAADMVMTKLVITNPYSVGNYSLKIQELLPLFVVNGLTLEKGGVVSVYNDAVLLGSLVLPKDVTAGSYNAFIFLNQALEIPSGKSATLTVKFVGGAVLFQSPTLRVDLPKNGLTWQWTGGKYYYVTDGLPFQGKTLTF